MVTIARFADDAAAAYAAANAACAAYAARARWWPPVEPAVQHAFEVVSGVHPPPRTRQKTRRANARPSPDGTATMVGSAAAEARVGTANEEGGVSEAPGRPQAKPDMNETSFKQEHRLELAAGIGADKESPPRREARSVLGQSSSDLFAEDHNDDNRAKSDAREC